MKRKLNERDVPEEVPVLAASYRGIDAFENMGLDPRLLQGVVREKWGKPTPVQAKAIPLAMEGKDILAQSRTGSGKTGAYVLPIIQSLLQRKVTSSKDKHTSALILVPARELAAQITAATQALTTFCNQYIRVENLNRNEDEKVLRARLADRPDILVCTPGKAASLLKSSVISLEQLTHLVIDEADDILGYGHEKDLEHISQSIPQGVQTFLMSATLKGDLSKLQGLFCRDPVMLELEDEETGDIRSTLKQYIVKCGEDEKFLLLYAIFKLKLIAGKTIVFVGDIDRCYRTKLFLEQFGIRSCVLNSELPLNSRVHVVEEFSKGVYDIIIATDENEITGSVKTSTKEVEEDLTKDEEAKTPAETEAEAETTEDKPAEAAEDTAAEPPEPTEPTKKKRRKDFQAQRKKSRRDPDYSVSRGIDFRHVACVLNFDLPTTSKSYTHRIGRTGRAGNSGISLSFVVPKDEYRKNKLHRNLSVPSTEHDEHTLAKIEKSQGKKGLELQPYTFDMAKLEGFRYRLSTALQHVTPGAVREARLKEIRNELMRSEKLKRHFEENPTELAYLRHDGELRPAKVQAHLKHVPEYLMPGGVAPPGREGGAAAAAALGVGYLKMDKDKNRIRAARERNRLKGKGKGGKGKKSNPLQTFRAKK